MPPMTPEQIEWIAAQTLESSRRAAEDAVRRFRNRMLPAFLLLLVGLGIALHGLASTYELRAAQVSECRRVNVLRAQSNLSNSVSFVILSSSAQRERALAHQTHGRTSKTHSSSATLLAEQAARLDVTRLTNCGPAVNRARTYRYPLAGPIGNGATGQLNPSVTGTLRQSERLVATHEEKTP